LTHPLPDEPVFATAERAGVTLDQLTHISYWTEALFVLAEGDAGPTEIDQGMKLGCNPRGRSRSMGNY
jgi:hypothetical protein